MDIEMVAAPSIRPVDWDPESDSELLCIDVHAETHDVKTFTFVSASEKEIAFTAGQYFAFDVETQSGTETRCYSISSSPSRRRAVSITVKRVAGGIVSNWLHDTLTAGQILHAAGPLGHFARPAGRTYLFLSGGSGITPVMSMVRDLADQAMPVDAVFLHAGRTPLDLVFRAELATIATRLKGLRLFFLPETLAGDASWYGLHGRISQEMLALMVPDAAGRTVLCCGPAPFMAAARTICTRLGVPAENYIEESFDAAVIEDVPTPLAVEKAVTAFKVTFTKQGRSIEVAGGQTVLGCAKKAGIKVPSSCATGLCGTCKSKLLSGEVAMNHNGGIRQREIDAGFFLPCCSKPLSDLVIER
ncbi:hybrid-cluster NAD(P)-dependent oxidoreductase [Rhizobium sp. Leaf341]|uniref:hybrid-cluster NAD(P)-dependent oxidoreductase n=1 Tax=Rhizobium sp. Leaf341 TaxID=1736344 RepID=UPI00071482E3|nr:hybrid-cluster NAD(P)-dependent oxidoreductase [Rhizobium sp. Leaf341]KQR73006.1 ferredoxin [Rhizobium sp. Leaf341]